MMAHGPSYWSHKEAADDAQREYDDAVRFDEADWKIRDAKRERDRTLSELSRVERTGE